MVPGHDAVREVARAGIAGDASAGEVADELSRVVRDRAIRDVDRTGAAIAADAPALTAMILRDQAVVDRREARASDGSAQRTIVVVEDRVRDDSPRCADGAVEADSAALVVGEDAVLDPRNSVTIHSAPDRGGV